MRRWGRLRRLRLRRPETPLREVKRSNRLRTLDEPTPLDTVHVVAHSIRRDSKTPQFYPRCRRARADSERGVSPGSVARGITRRPVVSACRSQAVSDRNSSAYHREISGALQQVRSASLHAITSATGRGTLDLAALPTFASKSLVPRLSDFYAKHGGILINLHARIGQFDLTTEGMDAAIRVCNGVWPGMTSYRLLDETLLPIISPALAAMAPIREPADISRHQVLRVAARPDIWARWFEPQGLDCEVMHHLTRACEHDEGIIAG